MIFDIHKVISPCPRVKIEFLGRVRANSQPKAILRAIEKWKIEDVEEQRKLIAKRKGQSPL